MAINNGILGDWISPEVQKGLQLAHENSFSQTPGVKQVLDAGKGIMDAGGHAVVGTIGAPIVAAAGMGTGQGIQPGIDFANQQAGYMMDRLQDAKPAAAKIADTALDQGERLIRGNAAVNSDVKKQNLDFQRLEMENTFKAALQEEKDYMHNELDGQLKKLKENGGTSSDAHKLIDQNITDPADREKLKANLNTLFPPDAPDNPFEKVKSQQQKDTERRLQNLFDGLDPNKVLEETKSKSELEVGETAMHKAAFNIAMREETPKNWYENRSFQTGLLRLGLGIMAGEDLSTAFGGATEAYANRHATERRETFRSEMLDSGYEGWQVDEWIRTGKKPDKPTTTKATDKWVDQKRHGVYGQQNLRTGDWESYGSGFQNALGKGGSGGTGGDSNFKSNAQVTIGSHTMPVSNATWYEQWGNNVKNYPLADDGIFSGNTIYTLTDGEGFWANAARIANPELRQAVASEMSWLQAYGRPLSGGAITKQEWRDWGEYLFPRPNESAKESLMKQYTRDIVAYTITGLKEKGAIPKEEESNIMNQSISQARRMAAQIEDFDPSTGFYKLKNGELWHPASPTGGYR